MTLNYIFTFCLRKAGNFILLKCLPHRHHSLNIAFLRNLRMKERKELRKEAKNIKICRQAESEALKWTMNSPFLFEDTITSRLRFTPKKVCTVHVQSVVHTTPNRQVKLQSCKNYLKWECNLLWNMYVHIYFTLFLVVSFLLLKFVVLCKYHLHVRRNSTC